MLFNFQHFIFCSPASQTLLYKTSSCMITQKLMNPGLPGFMPVVDWYCDCNFSENLEYLRGLSHMWIFYCPPSKKSTLQPLQQIRFLGMFFLLLITVFALFLWLQEFFFAKSLNQIILLSVTRKRTQREWMLQQNILSQMRWSHL